MSEHFDVVIVGAGLSGIGAACHLAAESPSKSYVILEARERMGGTWDLFRYPGIRSDSDMFTLGYSFRPWLGDNAIADGPSIRKYIEDTAREHDLERKIRYRQRVVRAAWSTGKACWLLDIESGGEVTQLRCSFLWGCSGYYRYDEGYSPNLEGTERFKGPIIHPQHWPEDLDYAGKRVVVIGSGATAVTLVPSLAQTAAHVTMLQRSPSWIVSLPSRDRTADRFRRLFSPKLAYTLARWKNVLLATASYQLSRRRPKLMKSLLRRYAAKKLPEGFDMDRHLTPSYEPWDQRLCIVPDGDLFRVLRKGTASIVTERITRFEESGIRLESGGLLAADIVVMATGLNVLAFGGIEMTVDGAPVKLPETIAYKGMMLSGVPNFAFVIGYTNASWTLKADLVSGYVTRLLNRMTEHGDTICIPRAPDKSEETAPFMDLKSGYLDRALDRLPKQGTRPPYRLHQNYFLDTALFKWSHLDEGMDFRGHAPSDQRPKIANE